MSISFNPYLIAAGAKGTFLASMPVAMQQSYFGFGIATTERADTLTHSYPFLGDAPMPTELKGTIDTTPVAEKNYSLTSVTYAASIKLPRRYMRSDMLRGFPLRVAQMAENVVRHQNSKLIERLTSGTGSTAADKGFDGVSFFSSSHTAVGDSGTGDNLIDGTGGSVAQIQADVTSAVAAMMAIKGTNGEYRLSNPTQFVIAAPVGLMGNMETALNAAIVSQTSNVQNARFSIKAFYDARLTATDANDWYLLHTGGALKPLLYQELDAPSLETQESPDSDSVFGQEVYSYKARYDAAFGYGHFGDAVKVVNS